MRRTYFPLSGNSASPTSAQKASNSPASLAIVDNHAGLAVASSTVRLANSVEEMGDCHPEHQLRDGVVPDGSNGRDRDAPRAVDAASVSPDANH